MSMSQKLEKATENRIDDGRVTVKEAMDIVKLMDRMINAVYYFRSYLNCSLACTVEKQEEMAKLKEEINKALRGGSTGSDKYYTIGEFLNIASTIAENEKNRIERIVENQIVQL